MSMQLDLGQPSVFLRFCPVAVHITSGTSRMTFQVAFPSGLGVQLIIVFNSHRLVLE
ncbi:hypothetical protein JG688_00015578 [Phytophthora aleatoria]|uniref:Uncharacterized protein n=1 Tax=Phytophthora aleatoria TaxID=2496075 RepID=A0A8J5IJS2_9STRA|nr:hypothetical protein JG688_00015578 [Phytophthora aleatoria]